MGRPRSRATMQDVELVDVADRSSAPADGDRPGPRAPRRAAAHPHRRRWTIVLVTVALVLAGVVTVGRAASRDVARPQLAAGMLMPLAGPPWSRWSAEVPRGDDVLAATGVLVTSAVRQGRFQVTAWDVDTGERRWQRDLGPVAGTRPLTGCPHDDDGVGDLVVCVVEPPVVPTDPANPSTVPFPAPDERWARVSAIDATTGEERGTWTLVGRLAAVERIGDDVVVLTVGPDGHARVARYSADGGHLRWWHRGGDRIRLREGIVSGSELRVNDAFVLVQGWSATVLDADDGTEIAGSPPSWFVIGALQDELFGTWSSGEGGAVRDRHGRELFRTDALFPALTATDREPSDVLVMDEGGELVGRLLPGGGELWRVETYRAARLQAGGRLVLLGVDGYQVVDVRSGELAWETPGRVLMWWAPLTDGTVVLGAGRTGDGAPTVEARRLSDGALEWALPLPDGVRSVTSVGGHLVLRTRDELILYG